MEPIPANIVEETWKRIASLSPRRAPGLIKRMGKEQPVVLAYLLAVDHDLLNDDERQLLLYLGVVVWQIMSQGSQPLPMITEDRLDTAEAKNIKMAEYLQGETEEGFLDAARTIINNYGQPEVLRYVVEAIMEEPEEGCAIRDENRGILFLDLKTVIDCFDS
jgi:hypothetical protein